MPVAVDQRLLLAQQLQHGLVLRFAQLVWVLDAQLRLGRLQVQRRIGDIDRPIIGLHAALVRLAVGQVLRLEQHAPAGGRLLEHVGVVQQHVRPPLVWGAVDLLVDHVPATVLQPWVDVLPVGDQGGIDWLHPLARDEPQRGIARGGDQVVAALGHQADHLVRGGGGLDADLAAGFLLEAGHPVVGLVAFTAFDVAGPGDDVQAALAGAQGLGRFGSLQAGAGQHGAGGCAEQCGLVH